MTTTDTARNLATVSALTPGTGVIIADLGPRGLWLPITEEHPGTLEVVVAVEPWILTRGPKAGQQAMRGRAPLLTVTMTSGRKYSCTADAAIWTLA